MDTTPTPTPTTDAGPQRFGRTAPGVAVSDLDRALAVYVDVPGMT